MYRKSIEKITTSLWQKQFLKVTCYRCGCKSLSTKKISEDQLESTLSSIVGKKFVAISHAAREQHSHDESYHRAGIPQVVVWPNSVEEVSEVAKACSAKRVAMIPFGTGTGLEGGVMPLQSSVCVNLTNLNEISDLHLEDFNVKVGPGVTRKQLNYELRGTGLHFPVDPGADASICGMAATGASGTNAVRYGTMKQNVLNLQAVLADGTIISTGGEKRRCRKSSAGYNLTELFVGSEGTLGFITSATIQLHGIPEKTLSAVCSFPSIQDAVNTTVQVLQCSIPIARIELLDAAAVDASNRFSDLSNPVKPTLFLEFHGTEVSTKEQVEQTAEIAESNNGSAFKWATTQEDVNHLWRARHDIFYAILALTPGCKGYSTDVCVPISKLPECIDYSVAALEQAGLTGAIVGHVGDGNFHCLLTLNENNMNAAKLYAGDIARKAISLGGTCTGEHGVGIGKKDLLREEVGDGGIAAMKMIKSAFDPHNLMNPGKVL